MPITLDFYQPKPPAKATAHEQTILLVDDDKFVGKVVDRMLKNLGYQTIVNGSGEDAIATLEHKTVDLVLSDLCFTDGMSGPEFAVQARQRHSDLKIIFMSGYLVDGGSQGFALNPNEVLLNKPFDYEQLGAAVRAALG